LAGATLSDSVSYVSDADESEERQLAGGWQTDVRERDGIVYRSPKTQSRTVLDLLRHLELAGFEAAPKVIGTGFAPDGRETLGFVDGAIQHPHPWTDAAVARLGELVRDLHRATSSFASEGETRWQPWFARSLPGDLPVIGHCDLGPWNILARNGMPVAFIDWDSAGPVDAVWELAQVAWLNVQLHDDDVADGNRLPDATIRARQLRTLLDAYGLDHVRRERFVDQIAELAIHEARQEAVDAGITASSTKAVAPNGFPIMWAVTWRARSASWILRNRDLLRDAILR
jgi:hypothetical protein